MSVAREQTGAGDNSLDKNRLTTEAIAGAGKPEPERHIETDQERPRAGNDRKESNLEPLFDENADHEFRSRWREIQTGFVDEPRSAVEQADQLVAELMQRLAQSFSEQRSSLERQWDASDQVSTEDLRVALTRYRSFFERLLSI